MISQALVAFQSGYRKHHSTKSALIRVSNDILRAIDDNSTALRLLFDLSASFDTVNQVILLNRLRDRFGIKGTALVW